MSMFLKTEKPITENKDAKNTEAILSYIENLKEEISFNLERLSKKIEIIQKNIKTEDGGAS